MAGFSWRQEIWGKQTMSNGVVFRGPIVASEHAGEELHISISHDGKYIGELVGIEYTNGAVRLCAYDAKQKWIPIYDKVGN